MTELERLPALRPIDITPFRDKAGNVGFQLRDPLGIAPQPLLLSAAGYYILAHLDGLHTLEDVQETFRRETGQAIDANEIRRVIEVLDHHAMLHTANFQRRLSEARDAYAAEPVRDNRDNWPEGPELRREIETLLDGEVGENVTGLRGIVAPHLDYPRGAPCYRAAYAALRENGLADRYVILGTNHFGLAGGVAATRKDHLTPLGLVPVDRATLDRLEARMGASLCDDELDHRQEHSVELQVHVLQVLHGERPFEIVPVLCPDVCGPAADGEGPLSPSLDAFVAALRKELPDVPGKTMVIAGADLSHVGQHFGDPVPTTPVRLAEVALSDRALLAAFEAGPGEAGLDRIRGEDNATRICSLGCMWGIRQIFSDAKWRTLRYHQALDFATETNVTCSAAIIYE